MAQLVDVHVPREPEAAVLVLHGGASRGAGVPVSPTQLSVIRMGPIAKRVADVGKGRLAVFRVLNTTRGWDRSTSPVDDSRWAQAQVRERLGDLPVGLVGHSLGGRAALESGDGPAVRSVVALNPWVYAQDDPDLTGRRVLIVHGTQDRIAAIGKSEQVARNIGRRTDVGFIRLEGGKHAMLSHFRQFDGYAAAFTAAALLQPEPARLRVPPPVRAVLDGERWVST